MEFGVQKQVSHGIVESNESPFDALVTPGKTPTATPDLAFTSYFDSMRPLQEVFQQTNFSATLQSIANEFLQHAGYEGLSISPAQQQIAEEFRSGQEAAIPVPSEQVVFSAADVMAGSVLDNPQRGANAQGSVMPAPGASSSSLADANKTHFATAA